MLKTLFYDVAVIGGGASGITAAIFAARCGAKTVILEKNARIGKKILATGNGRCNLLNANLSADRFYGDRDFISEALGFFTLSDVLSFFESIGLPCTELEDGKMYPRSLQATSVLDLLREELSRLDVEIKTDFDVKAAERIKGGFKLSAKDREVCAKKAVFACGGAASPQFGTDGSAYMLLTSMGLKMQKTFPALVQLQTENTPKALAGLKTDALATLFTDGKKVKSTFGEVLFTNYGLSGPPVFDLSRHVSKALEMGEKAEIALDLTNDIPFNELSELIAARQKKFSYLKSENFLNGLLPKKLGMEVMKKAKTPRDMASLIKSFKFTVIKTTGFKNAQVTAGGILTHEVSPDTFMSKKYKDLYITGEMLDVDGDCGGFNLSFAWCSGALAGRSAGKEFENDKNR